ncbi:MAG: RNA polymerase sigma factor [Bacteroidota bacterium]
MYKNLTNIIEACQKGERVSQKQLYTLFSAKLYGVCLRYSNNEEDAKDLLQEGFIKIFKSIKQYNHNGSFEGWMRKIIVNTALERFRKSTRSLTIDNDDYMDSLQLNYEHVFEELAYKDLMKMVQELSDQYRIVFNLYVIEGFSHKEISQKLNIGEGTSKSNLSRARELLKEKVRKQYKIKKTGKVI